MTIIKIIHNIILIIDFILFSFSLKSIIAKNRRENIKTIKTGIKSKVISETIVNIKKLNLKTDLK